jgi:hypothetical protein
MNIKRFEPPWYVTRMPGGVGGGGVSPPVTIMTKNAMKNILLVSLYFVSLCANCGVVPDEVVEEWGYQKNRHSRYLDGYCMSEVRPIKSTYQNIRSLKNSVEMNQAKYRFTLAKEVYSSESEARERENSIRKSVGRNSKQSKMCDLRKVKRVNNVVYFVHSDVGAFDNELQVIFEKLVGYVSKP